MSASERYRLVGVVIVACVLVALFAWSSMGRPAARDHEHERVLEGGGIAGERSAEETDAGASARIGEADAGTGVSPQRAPVRMSAPIVERDRAAGEGTIEGRVVALASGRGIAAAELVFAHDGSSISVRTDASGAFTLRAPEEGTYVLAVATADGFLPFAPEWGHSPVSWRARPGVRLRGVTVTLVDAVEYVAQVTSEERSPVASADVHVFGLEHGERTLAPLPSHYRTDARGEVRFVAPDGAVVEASHPEHGRGRARIDDGAQASHRVHIRLSRRPQLRGDLRITGHVVDPSDAPVEGALVEARYAALPGSREAELHPVLEATSDEHGRFVLEGADAGEYRLTARAAGYARSDAASVGAGGDVTIRLGTEARLRVRVRDAAGEPPAALTVVVTRPTGPLTEETLAVESAYDDAGEVSIGGLSRGVVRVSAVAPGYAPSPSVEATAVEGVETLVDLTIDRGGRIEGRVVSADDGRALAGARVTLEGRLGEGASAVPLEASAITDEQGSFSLGGVPPGSRSVVVWAADHHGRLRAGIHVVAGAAADAGTIDLAPVSEGEEPRLEMAGIGAVLSGEGDALVIGRVVDGGGAAESGLVPGDAILEVDGAPVVALGFEGSITRIRGPEGTVVRLRIRHASGSVEVRVVPRRRIRA